MHEKNELNEIITTTNFPFHLVPVSLRGFRFVLFFFVDNLVLISTLINIF